MGAFDPERRHAIAVSAGHARWGTAPPPLEGSRWDRMSPQARENALARNRRYRAAHREELRERDRATRAADPERFREYRQRYYREHRDELLAKGKARLVAKPPAIHTLYQHGVHPDELAALYREQGGRCAICDAPRPMRGPGCLFIDHDHETGERRGLICHDCNKALPVMERVGPTWALRVLAYLGDPPLRRMRRKAS